MTLHLNPSLFNNRLDFSLAFLAGFGTGRTDTAFSKTNSRRLADTAAAPYCSSSSSERLTALRFKKNRCENPKSSFIGTFLGIAVRDQC